MTPTPTPAALDAARKYVDHMAAWDTLTGDADDNCPAYSRLPSEMRGACICDYDARLAKLAAAFDAFAADAVALSRGGFAKFASDEPVMGRFAKPPAERLEDARRRADRLRGGRPA